MLSKLDEAYEPEMQGKFQNHTCDAVPDLSEALRGNISPHPKHDVSFKKAF